MGYLEPDEVSKYRKMYTLLGVGGGIFLIGFLILVFGRTYGLDGSHYDLYMVFGIIIVLIGLGIAAYPLAVQIRILFKGLNRKDEMDQGYGYMPPPSAADQVMRNTQIFSSAAPSTYDQGAVHHQLQLQQQQQQQQQQQYQSQFQQRGASYNPQVPHQFSSAAAAAMYRAGSGDQLAVKPAYSQSSLNKAGMPPPSYHDAYQQQQQPPPPPPPQHHPSLGRPPISIKQPHVSQSSEI